MKAIPEENSLSKRIQQVRTALKMNQIDMAALVGAKYRSYQANERGEAIPGGLVLTGYAKIGVNVNWLLTGEGPMMIGDAITLFETNGKPSVSLKNIDNSLLTQIVVCLENKRFNSPFSALKFHEFMMEIREPLQLALKLKAPEDRESSDREISKMIEIVREAWLKYAGTEAGIAAHIYNDVFDITDQNDRADKIQEEIRLFFSEQKADALPRRKPSDQDNDSD